ncbi:hypothetical protein PYCC9005_005193 [Savitreella phatthalungensis]
MDKSVFVNSAGEPHHTRFLNDALGHILLAAGIANHLSIHDIRRGSAACEAAMKMMAPEFWQSVEDGEEAARERLYHQVVSKKVGHTCRCIANDTAPLAESIASAYRTIDKMVNIGLEEGRMIKC